MNSGFVITGSYTMKYRVELMQQHQRQVQQTYNEISALLMYHWAYILQQVTSHQLHSNNQVNLPV